ncbi:uncharacterized protein LOC100898514 [Galendromus occidentalis]|uniref:Uncharacterized protein LOC100898514 n=1 Tax=Galendromus occidentalis TaxID=34638 RepID=A0AAJ6VZQ3_9ACAR|nr:uncharacterized protein LOC100898514 [Galendromus occidentalis]
MNLEVAESWNVRTMIPCVFSLFLILSIRVDGRSIKMEKLDAFEKLSTVAKCREEVGFEDIRKVGTLEFREGKKAMRTISSSLANPLQLQCQNSTLCGYVSPATSATCDLIDDPSDETWSCEIELPDSNVILDSLIIECEHDDSGASDDSCILKDSCVLYYVPTYGGLALMIYAIVMAFVVCLLLLISIHYWRKLTETRRATQCMERLAASSMKGIATTNL